MQCPKCSFEGTIEDFGPDRQCPNCGAYYDKAIRYSGQEPEGADPRQPANWQNTRHEVSARVQAAKDAVAEARQRREDVQASQVVVNSHVIVTDVNIRFWSLVILLVKLAFASIPALIIIVLVVAALTGFLGGLTSGVGRYTSIPAFSPPIQGMALQPDRQPELIHGPDSNGSYFYLVSNDARNGSVTAIIRTDSADGSTLFSRFHVHCSSQQARVAQTGPSLDMIGTPFESGFVPILAGSSRERIARRVCADA